MAHCRECDRSINGDELGLNLKLIDRNAADYLCICCMARYFGCGEDLLHEKIRRFKEIGCKLFPPSSSDN